MDVVVNHEFLHGLNFFHTADNCKGRLIAFGFGRIGERVLRGLGNGVALRSLHGNLRVRLYLPGTFRCVGSGGSIRRFPGVLMSRSDCGFPRLGGSAFGVPRFALLFLTLQLNQPIPLAHCQSDVQRFQIRVADNRPVFLFKPLNRLQIEQEARYLVGNVLLGFRQRYGHVQIAGGQKSAQRSA